VIALAGCSPEELLPLRENLAEHAGDVGLVRMAVLSKAPWHQIAGELAPNFKLTPAAAVAAVVPSTSSSEEKELDATIVSLALQRMPRTTPTGEPNVPDEAPEAADPSKLVGNRTAGALPGLSDTQRKSVQEAIDPITQYQAANALLQEVALLNKAVQLAALRDGYVPYFVRLQLAMVPYVRHQPYDTYTQLSFFIDDGKKYDRLPAVIPLLVTDNLEGSVQTRSADAIQQVSIAISLLQAGLGGALGVQKFNERFAALFGRDLNSLFTIGQIADNAIMARFGARRSPVSGYDLVARTHNVSLLVLIPKEVFAGGCDTSAESLPYINIMSHTQMRHANARTLLPGRPEKDFGADFVKINKAYDVKKNGKIAAAEDVSPLKNFIQTTDYKGFKEKLGNLELTVSNPAGYWAEMAGIVAKSHRTSTGFRLAPVLRPEIPAQTPIITTGEDGDKTILVLGPGTNPDLTKVVRTIKVNHKTYRFPAIATGPGANGGTLDVTFPNLSGIGIANESLEIDSLTVRHKSPVPTLAHCDAVREFKDILYRAAKTEKKKPDEKPEEKPASAKVNISIEAASERS
jgi:hypothetical protein